MGAGALPSFHDTYRQVLEQLEKLKRIHELQVWTAEVPPPRLSMEAGNQSGPWNGTENPDVRRLVTISQVVVDLGSNERESDGDGALGGVDDKDMLSRERIKARGGAQGVTLEKQTQTSHNEIPERGLTTSEVEYEDQKEVLGNLQLKQQHNQKETMEDEDEQRSWKVEEVWNQDDAKKSKTNEVLTFQYMGKTRGRLDALRGNSDAALADKGKDYRARNGQEREEDNDRPLLDVSDTTLHPNSDRETASQTDKSHRHSTRLEIRRENLKRELWHEVYEELTSELGAYIPFEKKEGSDSLLNFVNQISHLVRDQFDLLQQEETHSGTLRDALTRKHRENEVLCSEKAALQDKLDVILSALQQGSKRCANCQSVYNKANTKKIDSPIALLKSHKAVCVSPEVGEDVAVEVMRSLSMTHNHQSAADSSMDEGLLPVSKDFKRPSLGNGVGNPFLTIGVSSKGCPEVPVLVKKQEAGESSIKRKRGPEVFDLTDGGKPSVEKSKRLSDVERELVERKGVVPLVEQPRLSTNSYGSRGFLPKKPKGQGASPWVFVSSEESEKEDIGTVEAGKQGEAFQDEEENFKEEKESEGNGSGKKTMCDTETEDEDEETESDFESQDSYRAIMRKAFPGQLRQSGTNQAMYRYEGNAEEDERQQECEDEPRLGVGKYAEFECGVTSKLGEEKTGTLRAYESGVIEIFCHCSMGICAKGMSMTPGAFEKHGGRAASKKWRDSIWVKYMNQKMPVSRVKELDAYLHYPQRIREGRSSKES